MKHVCLAVDIGASSGRIIAGHLDHQRLQIKEIYRFENKMVKKNNHFCWDVIHLFNEIKKGIKECSKLGIKPTSIGIDTWAVDFVLLDENDAMLGDAVSYRDPRTDGMMEEVWNLVSKEQLYSETGIQFQKFNTIYQLWAIKQLQPDLLEKAKTFLMIPDYINYLLTGKKVNEYTNATSTQLVNVQTKSWDEPLLNKLGLKRELFQDIQQPPFLLGSLREELATEFGFDLQVILPATHDTGSAVIAVPETEETIYLSSGTWSLIGVETKEAECSVNALKYNFTNEGGMNGHYRFLKNIMGLWMIQEVKRNYSERYSFAELVNLAEQSEFQAILNVDDDRFLNPENMITEIQAYCQERKMPVPESPGDIAKCIFDSLVVSYQKAVEEIEGITDKEYTKINVIGGGSRNEALNKLIANATKKEVYAGPVEATAIGNIIAQLIILGDIQNIHEGREIVRNSFEVKKYTYSLEGAIDHDHS